jgi:hypothetical protein
VQYNNSVAGSTSLGAALDLDHTRLREFPELDAVGATEFQH